jgi:hypothetical protein
MRWPSASMTSRRVQITDLSGCWAASLEAGFEAAWQVEVVGVEDADPVAILGGELDQFVDGVVSAAVLPAAHLHAAGLEGLHHREGVVLGAVVNDDDAVWGAALAEDGLQALRDESGVVINWDDDGEALAHEADGTAVQAGSICRMRWRKALSRAAAVHWWARPLCA